MTAGKNKLTRYMRIYVGGYDLSGDARTVDSLDAMYADQDMSGWSDQVKKSLADMVMSVGIRGFQALMNDTASSGAHSLLKSPDGVTQKQVSVLLGGGASPAASDPAYLLTGVDIAGNIVMDGKAPAIRGDFVPMPGYMDGQPWGKVLMPNTSLAATTNGSTVDDAASSANGAHANLHILATASGNFEFKIEHSTDGISWATLGTVFTANGSAITSEYKTFTGTVNRYVRFVATRTGGTASVVCVFARK
jgi:hypothetical protein